MTIGEQLDLKPRLRELGATYNGGGWWILPRTGVLDYQVGWMDEYGTWSLTVNSDENCGMCLVDTIKSVEHLDQLIAALEII